MPMIRLLPRSVCEKLGDDVAAELVDLLNLVEQSRRSELHELRLDRQFAALHARLDAIEARLK